MEKKSQPDLASIFEIKISPESELKSHRARLVASQADRAELLMQIARGELIEANEVELAFSRIIDFFLSELKLMVVTLSADIAGKSYNVVERKLATAIDAAIDKARVAIDRELLSAKTGTKTKIDRKVREETSGGAKHERKHTSTGTTRKTIKKQRKGR